MTLCQRCRSRAGKLRHGCCRQGRLGQSETDIDSVTAISGSGPAYFFLLIDMLVQTATDMGLDDADRTNSRYSDRRWRCRRWRLNSEDSMDDLITKCVRRAAPRQRRWTVSMSKTFVLSLAPP